MYNHRLALMFMLGRILVLLAFLKDIGKNVKTVKKRLLQIVFLDRWKI